MKLNSKRTILVGFAFLLICMFWSVYDTVIAKVAVDSFGLNQFWSGVIMSIDNILALVLLPLFGVWSDKTKTKFGKRTPYIFIGTVIAAIFIVAIGAIDFMQQQAIVGASISGIKSVTLGEGSNAVINFYYTIHNVPQFFASKELAAVARSADIWNLVSKSNIGYLAAFIGILLIVLVAMASFRTPAVSLMPDVTPKPLRSKGNAIINLMGTAGGIVALVYMSFVTKDYTSYIPTFVLTAALMIVFLVIFITTVKEIKWTKDRHEQSLAYGIEDAAEVKEEEAGKGEKMSKPVRISFLLILASLVLWFIGYNAATSKFSVYASNVLNIGYTIPLLVANGAALISY
ncbi:MAG: MFS transporter, partial [Firmicutes bacterium]|nr:MFS transporter [Bacillota bacterium]